LSGNHVYGQAFLKSFDAVKRDRVTDALFNGPASDFPIKA
jgi:hypothetical protein